MKINLPKNVNKILFISISIIVLGFMLTMSRDAGISGDEYFHVDHAEKVYNFFVTHGEDTVATTNWKGRLNFYGQSLDNEIHIFNELFNIEDIYRSRHFFISLTGWILVLFSGLIASLLFGWRAGILAILFAFFSPKLLGHSFNNPKDLPFATAYIFTIYFILKHLKEIPRNRFVTLLFISLGIAWAISLRIGGVILIPYLFMFVGLYYLTEKRFYSKRGFNEALKKVWILLVVVVLGYFFGLILWPYALLDPINNPLASLKEMTNYGTGLNQIFEGEIQLSKNLPWYYGLKYILLTNPIIVFIGLLLFLGTVPFRKASKNEYLNYFYLFFAFAFPLAYIIYQGSNIYGGWRHLLWTYPPVIILAAGGFDYFMNKKNPYIKYGTLAIIALLLFHPVKHTFKNHPHQYVYYNQLVGGVKGAYGKYELDYYYHSLREGAEWLIENELSDDTIIIATNHGRITKYFFRNYPQVTVDYSRYYERSKNDWDYAIWANTHITPVQMEKGYWPPKQTLYTMDVDGVPIGAVVKRVSKEDLKGFAAIKKNRVAEAKQHFRNFLKEYPESEEVLEGYARACLMQRQYDSTIIYADRSVMYNPRQLGAWLLKASASNASKKYNEALTASNEMIKIKEDFAEGHFQKGLALKLLNRPNEALKSFQTAAGYKKEYYQAFMQMGEILTNYKNYKGALNMYQQVLKFKPNDFGATLYSAKCHHFLKDDKKAEELIGTLPDNRQNHLETVKLKFRIALSKNDMATAGRYLQMARNINNNAELFNLRAMYVLNQNNKTLAKQYLDKAAELDKINVETKDLMKLVQPAQATVQTQQQQQARPQQQQQSIMFQKPEQKKQTSPLKVPVK